MKDYDFPLEKGIEIQTKQLNDWRKVLKPEYFNSLVEYALENNHKATSGMQVCRGSELDCFVANMSTGNKPLRKKNFKVGDTAYCYGHTFSAPNEPVIISKVMGDEYIEICNHEVLKASVHIDMLSKIKLF